jgi:perosamine synthetase
MISIAHNRPLITASDRQAVQKTLASGWIAQGTQVGALEARFESDYAGGSACALSSGTASLFLALRALGVGQGDLVALPSYACSALLNAINMAGAEPCVVDVRADDFCIDHEAIQRQAASARFVIAVHAFGAPANVNALRNQGLQVIEDCCQSLGGETDAGVLGSSGEVAVFSFYATKIITGGQGGLIWTRDPAIARAVRDYREFDCREYYVPRFNFQMTDIQAAMINSQMSRLNAIRSRRAHIAARFMEALPAGLKVQSGLCDNGRMPYRFVVLAPDRNCRDSMLAYFKAASIGCIIPVARHELLHRYLELDPADYPSAERVADTSLSLPLYPGLTEGEVERVCQALQKIKL